MVTQATPITRSEIESDQKIAQNPDELRISTTTLTHALFGLHILTGAYAYWHNPQAALAGGLLGATFRMISGDNQLSDKMPDSDERAKRVSLMCISTLAAAYIGVTYNPQGFTNFQTFLLFYMGCEGVTNGLYPILRKIVN